MAYAVLVSTIAVCLSTFAVFDRYGSPAALTDTLFLGGPVLVLGIFFFVLSRKAGLRDASGRFAPLRVGLLSAWLPNFLILVLLSVQFFLRISNSETLRLDETTDYLLVLMVWVVSIATGALGAGVTTIARDRVEARQQ